VVLKAGYRLVDWQLVPVILIVAIAAWYLGRTLLRGWTASKSGCRGGCGCGAIPSLSAPTQDHNPLISTEEITTRLRQASRGYAERHPPLP
jgi:hypothetical protein